MIDAQKRSRRASGRVTLADVARAAEVSPITVSRALRGERSVAPELIERVRKAVEELNYVPDPAARALASQRSTQVLVLVPLLSNNLFVDVLEAIHRSLFPLGFQPLIGVTHYDTAEEELLLRTYLPMRPAGLLVTGFDRSEAARQLIARSGVPCVHMMEISKAPQVGCVGFSQADAGAAITQHMLERGYRRIAFAAAQLDPRVMQRAEGYRQALRQAGLYDPRLELLSPEPSSMALGAGCSRMCLPSTPTSMPSSSATTTWRKVGCWPPTGWASPCPGALRWQVSTTLREATRWCRPSPPCARRAGKWARPRRRCCWS